MTIYCDQINYCRHLFIRPALAPNPADQSRGCRRAHNDYDSFKLGCKLIVYEAIMDPISEPQHTADPSRAHLICMKVIQLPGMFYDSLRRTEPFYALGA